MPHIIIALAIQIAAFMFTDNWWVGAAAGAFYFIGREYAQAEHRVIQAHYVNRRSNAPFWCGLELRAWTKKGALDWILPSIFVFSVSLLMTE